MMPYPDCALSVDAGGTSLKAAFIGADFCILQDSFYSVPVNSGGSEREIRRAYESLGRTAARNERRLNVRIRQVSVCIPGPYDYPRGVSRMKHKYQSVYGIPMRPWMRNGLGRELPIRFLHDSTAFLLGACADIPDAYRRRVCAVLIGTGLGFASMIDGTVLERDGGGPEISIFGRPYGGRTAEDYVSKRGILARYRDIRPDYPSCEEPEVKDIADLAFRGDVTARRVFFETGTHLGRILQPILCEYGFDLLILGGAVSKSAGLFLPGLKKSLGSVPIEIRPASDPDSAPLIGAAMYR